MCNVETRVRLAQLADLHEATRGNGRVRIAAREKRRGREGRWRPCIDKDSESGIDKTNDGSNLYPGLVFDAATKGRHGTGPLGGGGGSVRVQAPLFLRVETAVTDPDCIDLVDVLNDFLLFAAGTADQNSTLAAVVLPLQHAELLQAQIAEISGAVCDPDGGEFV